MSVDGGYPLVCILLQQLAGYQLLQREHHAVFAPNANRRATVLHRLHCIFDLKVTSIGGEDRVGEIVARPYRRLLRWVLAGNCDSSDGAIDGLAMAGA